MNTTEEQSVSTEPSGGLRSAVEIADRKALMNHLTNFSPPESDPVPEGAEPIEIPPMDLPEDAVASHRIMQQILATEPLTEREEKIKRAKLAKVRAHLHDLEQGPQPPKIPQSYFMEISSHSIRDVARLRELAKAHPKIEKIVGRRLLAAGVSNESPSESAAPVVRMGSDREEQIWSKVRADIAEESADCLEEMNAHSEGWSNINSASLWPSQAASDAKLLEASLVPHCNDLAETRDLSALLVELRGLADSPAIALEAARRSNQGYCALDASVRAMVAKAEQSLDDHLSELLECERQFFSSHGLPPETTSVSKVIASMKNKLEAAVWRYRHMFDRINVSPSTGVWPKADPSIFEFLFRDLKK